MYEIIRDVLFPILSYSEADEELWNTDPYEYIRVKFGTAKFLLNKIIYGLVIKYYYLQL